MNEITIEMRRETIEDIVMAIRERSGIGFDMGRPEMMDLADRIETAYSHDKQCALEERAVLEYEIECFNSAIISIVETNSFKSETITELRKENARLIAALKPILECEDTVMDTGDGHTLAWYAEYEKSVDEAKRIYKEGAHE